MLAEPHGAADTASNRLRPANADDRMAWQKRREMCRHANWSHAGSAAAVRNRKRLVQVQMADVCADRRGTRQPDLRVHVRAVHVHLTADSVNDGADFRMASSNTPWVDG